MEEMLAAIGNMVSESVPLRCAFIDSHLVNVILKIIAAHEANETVVDQAFYVMANLIRLYEDVGEESEENKFYCVNSFATDNARVNANDLKKYYKSCFNSIHFSSGFRLLSRVASKYSANGEIARNSCALFGGLLLCSFLSLSKIPSTAKVFSVLRYNLLNADSALINMADAGMLNALTSSVAAHEQNQDVVQYGLMGILQLCAVDKNIHALRSNGLCSTLVNLLVIHHVESPRVVLLSFEVMIQMCSDAKCRELFGRLCMKKDESLILAVLAHNMQNVDVVKAGCELISSLCICPTDDALAVTSREWYESLSISNSGISPVANKDTTEETTKTSTSVSKNESILEKFTSIIYNPNSSNTAQISDFGLLMLDNIGAEDSSSTSNIFFDAANNIISTGLSDQDAKRIEQSLKTEEMKPIGDGLIDCGALPLLLGILETPNQDRSLVVAVINALNSLCVVSNRRIRFIDSEILKKLIELLDAVKSTPISHHEIGDNMTKAYLRAIGIIMMGTLCLPITKSRSTDISGPNSTLIRVQGTLVSANVIDLLLDILAMGIDDSLLCETILRSLFFLTDGNEETRSCFSSSDSNGQVCAALIVKAMRVHNNNFRVVYYAALTVYAVCLDREDNCRIFGEEKIHEVLLTGMKNFLHRPDVCESCCHAIFALKPLNQQLGRSDACSYTLQALTTHPANNKVAEWVCRAIGSLVENDGNKQHLDSLGVCKIITGALQRHVATDNIFSAFSKDTSSAGVAQWGCTAIYYLSKGLEGESFQNKLVEAGACEAVAKALVKYSEIETVSYCCCRALVVLLFNNDIWKSKLGSLGVCACIVESLHLYPASVQVRNRKF
jgi:hypothetical protein